MIGAYAVARLLNGGVEWVYMPLSELDKIRDVSKSKDKSDSPWKKWPEEMYKKIPIRRLHKIIPTTPQMSLAKALDERATTEESQNGLAEAECEILDDGDNGNEVPMPETKSDKMARKFEKKNGKPEERPKPEPDNARTPSRMELEAELFSLIAENEDMLKSILGEDSEVLKYNNKQVAGWTVGGVQDAIKEVRMILDSAAEPDDDVEPELGL